MTKLEELIAEYCPNGVKYKKIKNTVGVNRGRRLTKSQLSDDAQYEVYHGSKDSILGRYSNSNAPANTTIVVNTGGIGGVKFLDKPFWCSDGSFWLGHSNEILDKYLYYCLAGKEEYFASQRRVGGVPTIDKSVVEEFFIPVPPLPVQREIVRILDNFAELTTQLTAELTARKKQYEYYREQLLTPMSNVQCKMCNLGDLCDISAGGDAPDDYSKEKVGENIVPIISNGIGENAFYGYTKTAKINKPSVTISARGTIGYAEYRDYPYFPIVRLITATPKDDTVLSAKYLYYCLQGKKYKVQKSGIAQLTAPEVKRIEITIPNIDVQKKIADTLDNFDAICSDLKIGLPAEIEARQKQYEYYRDKLLTFKPAE